MQHPQPNADSTPLQHRLATLIRAHGPISVADYLADALGHPQEGYYMTQDPIGSKGDFTTAPEVSQMFGELIGAWLVQSWIDMGEPSIVQLVELGPGRGVLMADILRAAKVRAPFMKAVRVTLVETSGRMRYRQQTTLKEIDADIRWTANLSEVAPGPMLLVANEFLDCMPIRQFIKQGARWHERLVGLEDADSGSEELAFTVAPDPSDVSGFLPKRLIEAEDGAVFEYRPAADTLMEEVAARLNEFKGRALMIDYGHELSGLGDTIQAVRNHKYWPPLSAPGLADITSHVDFEPLARAAANAQTSVYGPVTQGAFLQALGLDARAEALAAASGDTDAVSADVARLSGSDKMGDIFKVMCLSHMELATPAGFE